MGWVRLDDAFFRHPKVANLSKDAKLLFMAGLTYCAGALTDGFVSTAGLRIVAAEAGVKATSSRELVDAGLWHKRGDGFDIHDYLEYQPSAESERKRRAETKERVRNLRQRRRGGASGNAVTPPPGNAVTPPVTRGVTDPPGNAVSNAARTQDVRQPRSRTPCVSSSSSDLHRAAAANGELETHDVETQLAQRMVGVVTDAGGRAKLEEARAVSAWALRWLDASRVDETIGRCAELADPPRTIGYFAKAMMTTAADWGVNMPPFG